MNILNNLLSSLSDGHVLEVRIGLHYTSVVVDSRGMTRCGLASTLNGDHQDHSAPEVPQAGYLEKLSSRELASLSQSENVTLASVGVAAINALLPPQPNCWKDLNAEEVITLNGADKAVALVGNFPFMPRLRSHLKKFTVIERIPRADDLSEEAYYDVLHKAEVVAITGMTLINHTLEGLLELCSPDAVVILLGPSTPLSPILFDHGIDLSGSVVTARVPVVRALCQGANFRQVHRIGVRLITMSSRDPAICCS